MKDEIKKQGVRNMLNVNRIGNQVSFRALSSADLNQRLNSAPASQASTQATETAAPKKSHKTLTAIGLIAVLAGAGYLAKTGKLGEAAQKYFAQAAERVSPYLETAKTNVLSAYESAKTTVLGLKDKAVGLFKKA